MEVFWVLVCMFLGVVCAYTFGLHDLLSCAAAIAIVLIVGNESMGMLANRTGSTTYFLWLIVAPAVGFGAVKFVEFAGKIMEEYEQRRQE